MEENCKIKRAVIFTIILLFMLLCIVQAIKMIDIIEKIETTVGTDTEGENSDVNDVEVNTNNKEEPDYIYIDQEKSKEKDNIGSGNTIGNDENNNTDTNNIKEGFYIEDNNSAWEGTTKLPIFKDITYNFRELIVPGSYRNV